MAPNTAEPASRTDRSILGSKDRLDALEKLNDKAILAQTIGHKQIWREDKRMYGPMFDFKQHQNPFKNYNFDFKDNTKISSQYESKETPYKLGYDFLKRANAERYDYQYKYYEKGVTNGMYIREHYGADLVELVEPKQVA